ncbi:MAG: cation:proton antiporter [Firmicutes bacterium]|nr:cation:proton antiporter [Bacillota bacterium]
MIEFIIVGIFFVLLALCLTWRLYKGPSVVDRALCADCIENLCACALIMVALFTGRSIYLDVSLVVSILGFVSTVLVAKYLEGTL